MTPFVRVLTLVFLATALFSQPAFAQSKKELAAQDAIILDRLARLESRMLTGDPAAERLMQRMDNLEENMRTLTGEVERLQFERDNLRTDIAGLVQQLEGLQALATRTQTHLDAVDLIAQEQSRSPGISSPNTRFSSGIIDNTTTHSTGNELAGSANQSDPYFATQGAFDPNQPNAVSPAPTFGEQVIGVQQYDANKLPETGQQKLAEGDFSGAQTAFKQYLDIYPEAEDAADVYFWLGESYFVRGGYADAADAYVNSMRRDSKGRYAPNAMVGLAAAVRELGNKAEACSALDSFPIQYPNAPEDVRNRAAVERARTGC